MTFNAQAGIPYHLWMRGKADKNNWANDSVYVQFSGAVDAAAPRCIASARRRPRRSASKTAPMPASPAGAGTTTPTTALATPLYFATTGPQTIRVQVREDGLSLDQIVLSSSTYLTRRQAR